MFFLMNKDAPTCLKFLIYEIEGHLKVLAETTAIVYLETCKIRY